MAGEALEYRGVRIVLEDASLDDLRGSVIVTGFRGFGMVGFNVSKYLALGLPAKRVGFIISEPMPPIILVEEDGVGFPYDIYYSPRAHAVIIVNRGTPDKEVADKYADAIAEFARRIESKFVVLVGGLNDSFRPADEKYGYRHLPNKYYSGPELEAPEMEQNLGVVGPLALLYIYLTAKRVPAIVILPYATADQIDVDAARRGIIIISEKLLGVSVSLESLKRYEEMLRREQELEEERRRQLIQLLSSQAAEKGEEEGRKGMYM